MSVHYKFKNMIQYDSVKFDGVYISAAELKNIIIQQKRLVKGDSDLLIEDEEKRCIYTDDQMIPMNTTLVVSRVPFKSGQSSSHHKNKSHGSNSTNNSSSTNSSSNHSNSSHHNSRPNHHHHGSSRYHPYNSNSNLNSQSTITSSINAGNSKILFSGANSAAEANKLSQKSSNSSATMNTAMTEEERIKQIHSQSTRDYDPSRYMRGRRYNNHHHGGHHGHHNKATAPSVNGSTLVTAATNPNQQQLQQQYPIHPGYTCHRCGLPGHHIKNCPSHLSHKIKLSSGIPRSFMVPSNPDVKGAMMTPSGQFAIPYIDHQAYKDPKKEKAPFLDNDDDDNESDCVVIKKAAAAAAKPHVPPELQCGICHELLNDAVLVKCCQNKFCDDCIRTSLINSDTKQCPACYRQGISPDELIPSEFIRQRVAYFNHASSRRQVHHDNSNNNSPGDSTNGSNYANNRIPDAAAVDDENTSDRFLDEFEMFLKQRQNS